MDIGDLCAGVFLDGADDLLDDCLRSLPVEENFTGIIEQSDSPTADENRADDSHDGVHPNPAEVFRGQQCGDGRDGGQRIGEDMNIGRTEIVVFMMRMVMTVFMRMVVVMLMMSMVVGMPENQRADAVYHQTDNRDGNGLIEDNGNGMQEAHDAFIGHDEGKEREQRGTGEGGERIDFACSETEAGVVGVFSCEDVGDVAEEQREGMGGHVQAIGEQGHGAVHDTGGDFDGHHGEGNQDDDEGALFPGAGDVLPEGMGVG